jgi:quinol-cytochrome oxidoreductase complex cytochrome b subunit
MRGLYLEPLFLAFYRLGFNYPAPVNLSYAWNFGSLAFFFLIVQIVTGVFLASHYVPNVFFAFQSVEYIMREVEYGWLLRYIHANGASFFFFFVYCHMFRN